MRSRLLRCQRPEDEDYAVINSNYAIAGLDPTTDALAIEDGYFRLRNRSGLQGRQQEEPKLKALAACPAEQQVKDFMDENYKGAVGPLWRTHRRL